MSESEKDRCETFLAALPSPELDRAARARIGARAKGVYLQKSALARRPVWHALHRSYSLVIEPLGVGAISAFYLFWALQWLVRLWA